jgi:hypothetical protein
MPIYEYFCPNNNTVYQFYAKSIAQGETIPKCPDNPKFKMQKMVSGFAITKPGASGDAPPAGPEGPSASEEDPKMEAAMAAMESEFAHVDENDPRAMGRMMRKMAEMTGEKLDGEMEEVVRKLEEGADPESLEEQMGADEAGMGDPYGDPMGGMGGGDQPPVDPKEPRQRFKVRRPPPRRDPQLYDYE